MKKWFNDWKNKTLLDYTIKKFEKDLSFDIVKEENVEWDNLDFELKEKIVMGALKTKPVIRKLIEIREYSDTINDDGINKKILTYYS